MDTIQHLKGLMQDRHRQARAMLADKGSQHWSVSDQATFDRLMDDAERAQAAVERGDTAALHLARSSSRRTEHLAAFELFLRSGNKNLSATDRRRFENAMSTTTPNQGGYAVPTFVASELVNMIAGYGFVRRVARRIVTSNGAAGNVPASDATSETGEQLAENVSASSSDPTFAGVSMNTYKFGSKVFTVPIELLQDSAIDIVEFVLNRAHSRIGRIQNQRFTMGTGTGQPTGINVAAAVGRTGAAGQTTTVTYDDLVHLSESVDEAYTASPSTSMESSDVRPGWMMSQAMRKQIRLLKDAAGRPLWMPMLDTIAVDGTYENVPLLLDVPVYINNDMPAPAAGVKSLLFGNLRSYLVRDALDVQMLRFDDSAYTRAGQVGFLAIARAGGNLQDANAVKAYQHPAS